MIIGMDILAFACADLAPQIRVVKDDRGEPWFVASDACGILGISDVSAACRKLEEADKGRYPLPTPGGVQEVLTISEAGLYWLIVRSDKPQAKPFIRWVTHEVLPAIRRTGQYVVPDRKPTRWGWQPIRVIMREKGYTAKDFVQSANALNLPVPTFSGGNFAAWSYGGCLPAESLVVRAEALLGEPRERLFTADVLANYQERGPGKRHDGGDTSMLLRHRQSA